MSQLNAEQIDNSFELAPDESPVLDALEAYSQFIDELFDHPRSHSAAWEGNVGKTAVRSMARVLYKWRSTGSEDQPPMSLIVRLSRKLGDIVADIGRHPRRVLQRQRTMEPVNRFRELDSTCIRWLIRQPGLSVVEKAGHRRQILAVQRFESTNTLENRVLVDLLHRCRRLANDYLRQHQSRFPKHPWIQITQRFRRICDQFIGTPELAHVRPLTSLPQPNYVLLHESRYYEIWLAYVKVMRQQQRRQELWKNRQAIFTEMCIVSLWNSASRLAKKYNSSKCKSTHRSDLWIRDSLVEGCFFNWQSCPADWSMADSSALTVSPGWFGAERFGLPNKNYDMLITTLVDGNREKQFGVRFELPLATTDSEQVTVTIVSGDNKRLVLAPLNLTKHPEFFNVHLGELTADD